MAGAHAFERGPPQDHGSGGRPRAAFPDVRFVQTHMESLGDLPSARRDATADHPAMVEAIVKIGQEMEGAFSCRDVWIMEGEGRMWVSLACLVPEGMTVREAHQAATRVEKAVRTLDGNIGSVTVHTEPAE